MRFNCWFENAETQYFLETIQNAVYEHSVANIVRDIMILLHRMLLSQMKSLLPVGLKLKCFHNAFKAIQGGGGGGGGGIIKKTALQKNDRLSKLHQCNVFFKREDQQTIRSFKIRGAYNKIINSPASATCITVSAGNHAQGVAFICNELKRNHHIFLPEITPLQKVNRIKYFGGDYAKLHLVGTTFDESLLYANKFSAECENSVFVHPFDDTHVIVGQGTVAMEIYEELKLQSIKPDVIMCPVGGGGLISGVGSYSKHVNEKCMIYGVEAENANSMELSLKNGRITSVENLDTFVDGASVKTVGTSTFEIARHCVDGMFTVENNHLCKTMIDVYQNDGIILEPAGALSLVGLEKIPCGLLKGKNVVCITSGGNNDITRYPTIIEKALTHQNLKHYFIVNFAQRPGELLKFMNNVLGVNDDITRFEYLKKNNKDYGCVLIGIEVEIPNNIEKIRNNMSDLGFNYTQIKPGDMLYSQLI